MITRQLLERTDDLRVLSAAFENAAAGAGTLVIVRGDSGLGKTALVTEFAANAEKSGAIVLRGRADRLDRSIPFAPVVHSLLAHLDGEKDAVRSRLFDGLSVLGRLFVDEQLPASDVSTPDDPSAAPMFEAVSRLVGRLADRAPVLWWIDDIDRADTGTIEFLHFAAERLAGRRVVIVLCCRPFTSGDLEILARPAAGRMVVDLLPLTQEAAHQLVAARLNPANAGRAKNVVSLAGGVPGFLVAMTEPAASTTDDLSPEVSATVMERINDLSGSQQAIMRMLSVGRQLRHQTLDAVLPDPTAEVDQDCRTLIDLRLITAERSPIGLVYYIAHPLYDRAIYADLGEGQRSRSHARMVQALENTPGARSNELARHYRGAAALLPRSRTIEVLTSAGREALRAGALTEAIADLEVVASLLNPTSDTDSYVATVSDLGSAYYRSGRQPEAGVVWRQIVELLGPDDPRSAAVSTQLAFVESDIGNFDASKRLSRVSAASSTSSLGSTSAALQAIFRLMWVSRQNDPEQARAIGRELQRFGIDPGDDTDRAVAAIGDAHIAFLAGDLITARGSAERALGLWRETGDEAIYGAATRELMRSSLLLGDLPAARRHADGQLAGMHRHSPLAVEASGHAYSGLLALLAGDLSAARASSDSGLRLARRADNPRVLARCLLTDSLIRAQRNEAGQALADLGEAGRVGAASIGVDTHLTMLAECVQAELFLSRAATSSPSQPGFAWWTCTDGAALILHPLLLGRSAIIRGELDAVDTHVGRLGSLSSHSPVTAAVSDRLAGLKLLGAGAPAATVLNLLDRSADRLSAAGIDLLAAQTRLEWAELAAEQGRPEARQVTPELVSFFDSQDVRGWGDRARRLARTIGLRLPGRRGGPGALTGRETEVARLAAAGRSNAQIASTLFLSPRTVETHMRNIYARLGIESRIDLARHLDPGTQADQTGS